VTAPDLTSPAAPAASRADDGYFGPDSISWRLFADPSSKLGGVAAVLMQSLNPNMMRLFDKVSHYESDPQGRSERTARYIDTTIFGDRAHADAAGASIQRMHAHAKWTDPQTGEALSADHQPWLIWTHHTVVWGVLRAADAFGPELSVAEQDQFVREQHIAARLAGITTEDLPATRAELDEYIDEQREWMALTLPAATLTREFRKPVLRGNPLKAWTGIVIGDGILSLLPDWGLLLFGIAGRPMNLKAAARTTRRMIAVARRTRSYEDMITDMTTRVDTHPYRKLRGEGKRRPA